MYTFIGSNSVIFAFRDEDAGGEGERERERERGGGGGVTKLIFNSRSDFFSSKSSSLYQWCRFMK